LYDLSAQTFATSGIIKQEAKSQILLISAAELITEHEITQIILTIIVLRTQRKFVLPMWHTGRDKPDEFQHYHSSNPKAVDINMHRISIDRFSQQV
jgi:hypothetical protein